MDLPFLMDSKGLEGPLETPTSIQQLFNLLGADAPGAGVLGVTVNTVHLVVAANWTWPLPSNVVHAVARAPCDGLVLDVKCGPASVGVYRCIVLPAFYNTVHEGLNLPV